MTGRSLQSRQTVDDFTLLLKNHCSVRTADSSSNYLPGIKDKTTDSTEFAEVTRKANEQMSDRAATLFLCHLKDYVNTSAIR